MMLKASAFNGDEDGLRAILAALWADLAKIIVPHAVAISGVDDVKHRRRKVRFLDSADHWLREQDYVLRERIDLDKDERKITLKFRHPDRYISQDRDMQPAGSLDADLKFEEDIKPPFQKLFSYSSNVVVDDDKPLSEFKDIAALYPGLPDEVEDFPAATELQTVGDGFIAWELVVKGTSFQIRKDPEVQAECSVTLWYADETGSKPIVAEFSFKYESDEEDISGKMSRRAYAAYLALQDQLGDWLDPKSNTKTAYVYQR